MAIIGINRFTGNVFGSFDTGPSITDYGTILIEIRIEGTRSSLTPPSLPGLRWEIEKQLG